MIKVSKNSYQHLIDLLSDETRLNFQYYREDELNYFIKNHKVNIPKK